MTTKTEISFVSLKNIILFLKIKDNLVIHIRIDKFEIQFSNKMFKTLKLALQSVRTCNM